MSTGLELIPIAIAIGVAVGKARKPAHATTQATYALETRFKDPALLRRALTQHDVGANWHGKALRARIGSTSVDFLQPSDGAPFEAVLPDAVPVGEARQALTALDATYIAVVQSAVRERVLSQAVRHGLEMESERVEADQSIVITLRLGNT